MSSNPIITTLSGAGHPLDDQLKYIKRYNPNFYEVIEIDLGNAHDRTSDAYEYSGDTLAVASIDGTADVVFNDREKPAISLNLTRNFITPYNKFYIINSAQVGKTLKLLIGKDAQFSADTLKSVKVANALGSDINPLTTEHLTPIAKANQDATAELADTDILAADITTTSAPCTLRVSVLLSIAGVFSAMITTGGTQRKCKLNAGNALTADCLYTFEIQVFSGDTVNFQTSVNGDVTLRVAELAGGVA
jgi:hypothetical protein